MRRGLLHDLEFTRHMYCLRVESVSREGRVGTAVGKLRSLGSWCSSVLSMLNRTCPQTSLMSCSAQYTFLPLRKSSKYSRLLAVFAESRTVHVPSKFVTWLHLAKFRRR